METYIIKTYFNFWPIFSCSNKEGKKEASVANLLIENFFKENNYKC